MPPVVYVLLSILGALFRSQLSVRIENVALRHQLSIYRRTVRRPIIRPEDRILWSLLSRCWAKWRTCWSSFILRPLSLGSANAFAIIGRA